MFSQPSWSVSFAPSQLLLATLNLVIMMFMNHATSVIEQDKDRSSYPRTKSLPLTPAFTGLPPSATTLALARAKHKASATKSFVHVNRTYFDVRQRASISEKNAGHIVHRVSYNHVCSSERSCTAKSIFRICVSTMVNCPYSWLAPSAGLSQARPHELN